MPKVTQQTRVTNARPVPGPMDPPGEPRYILEPTARRVRVKFGNETVGDTTRAQLLFETGKLPVYYFPRDDVRMDLLTSSGADKRDDVKGTTEYFDVNVGERIGADAAWICQGEPAHGTDLSGMVAFDWNKMDRWFEEDEEVFVHARDPYHRVDVLESSRHVEVFVNDEKVADSRRPLMLLETGLPTRFYLPKMDIRLDLLERSDAHTACPYKGTADYWDVRTEKGLAEAIVWGYERPIPEIPRIAGRLCFFNEKVDMKIDGELQVRPRTKWS
jgi:uncharacterized protein (DUF427 family)